MTIKQGALVKAWDDDPSDCIIGTYDELWKCEPRPHYIKGSGLDVSRKNAIEIPPELAKALEELGNE